MNTRTEHGFTLIEILVVVAIIGLLAAVIIGSFSISGKKGRDARRIADIREIQNALELYYQECGSYPAPLALSSNNGNNSSGTCPSGVTLGKFIPSMPVDPLSKKTYMYAAFNGKTTTGGSLCIGYHLGAQLEQSDTTGKMITAPNTEGWGDKKCANGNYGGTYTNGANTGIAATQTDFVYSSSNKVYDVVP